MNKMREYDTTFEARVFVLDANNDTPYNPRGKAEKDESKSLKITSKIKRVDIEKYFKKQ